MLERARAQPQRIGATAERSRFQLNNFNQRRILIKLSNQICVYYFVYFAFNEIVYIENRFFSSLSQIEPN